MPTSMHFTGYCLYPPLNKTQILGVTGRLLNNIYLDQPMPISLYPDLVYDSQISVNVIPEKPIVKMAKRGHVDAFFDKGILRLGTFHDFNKYDHKEIGDSTEGKFLLVGNNKKGTAFAELGGGFNQFAFCCYAGEPDPSCVERFGYEDCYKINDPVGFARVISATIGAIDSSFASCVYSKDKVLVSSIPDDFDFSVVSHHLLNLASIAKLFIKPMTYSHQCEFRFLWQMSNDIELPKVIECPDAIQFCERIKSGT